MLVKGGPGHFNVVRPCNIRYHHECQWYIVRNYFGSVYNNGSVSLSPKVFLSSIFLFKMKYWRCSIGAGILKYCCRHVPYELSQYLKWRQIWHHGNCRYSANGVCCPSDSFLAYYTDTLSFCSSHWYFIEDNVLVDFVCSHRSSNECNDEWKGRLSLLYSE